MSTCEPFGAAGPGSIAETLQKVDCLANEATSMSFGRLFGPGGSLTMPLTIVLTLYVGFLALNLLTGRSTLSLSALTPRMMTQDLILTFVTSWFAYQSVVWNLAVGAPDEIASALVGSRGSATILFAQRLDTLFTAVSNAAEAMSGTAAANDKLASPASMLWISSLMLLLGTVGVLVVCRIALAALLILGPVFIVMALFEGTRGLFEGWLKSVLMFALVPLLTVVMGSGALMAIQPMVAGLESGGAEVPLRTAVAILVASIVYVALMLLVVEVAGNLTRGWSFFRGRDSSRQDAAGTASATSTVNSTVVDRTVSAAPASTPVSERVRTTVASLGAVAPPSPAGGLSFGGGSSAAPMAYGAAAPSQPTRHGLYFSNRTQGGSAHATREVIR